MRCLSCNDELTDKEANRKFLDAEHIKNPEDQYIGLCDGCLSHSDLSYYNEEPDTAEVTNLDDVLDLTGDCV
jgi:hypothetical protein